MSRRRGASRPAADERRRSGRRFPSGEPWADDVAALLLQRLRDGSFVLKLSREEGAIRNIGIMAYVWDGLAKGTCSATAWAGTCSPADLATSASRSRSCRSSSRIGEASTPSPARPEGGGGAPGATGTEAAAAVASADSAGPQAVFYGQGGALTSGRRRSAPGEPRSGSPSRSMEVSHSAWETKNERAAALRT